MEPHLSLTGLDPLLDAFARYPAMVRGNLTEATRDNLSMLQREARRTHRFQHRTGRLQDSVETTLTGPASGRVFLNQAVAGHAASIHDGSRPHIIRAKNSPRPVLRWVAGGRFRFAKIVNHPGTNPDPFLERAAVLLRGSVEMRYQQAVNESIVEANL